MTNDTTTLNGALSELGETMADNLVAMGVLDATASDGLTTLAGKILLVEPSISGLDLDTAVTLSASNESIILGSSVVLTSKLTASYDDETLVDVDLNGVLTGATILFKEGSTTIGSGVSDSNGVVTATISNLSAGSHIIKAVFEGTANFNACESSSITVVVSAVDSVTLVSDKNILSYADGESATLTATCLDSYGNGVQGVTVSFDVVESGVVVENIGTDVTDANGVCSVEYYSNHAGIIYIQANSNNIFSTQIYVDDLIHYGWDTNWITVTGATISITDEVIVFENYPSYSGSYIFNPQITVPYVVEVTFNRLQSGGFVYGVMFCDNNNSEVTTLLYSPNGNYWGDMCNGEIWTSQPNTDDVFRFEVRNGSIATYKNDTLLATQTDNTLVLGNLKFALRGTDAPRRQSWKNIKIRTL